MGLTIYTLSLAPWGHDVPHHIFKLGDLYAPFSEGHFRNILSPNMSLGLGLPAYAFYSQWIYIPPFLLMKLGFSMPAALAITYLALLTVAFTGFYKLAQLHVDRFTALIAALLFITSNYVLGDIYARYAYSEFFGYALLPFLLYYLHKALTAKSFLSSSAVITVGTVMLLVHPLSFINSSVLISLYGIMIINQKGDWLKLLLIATYIGIAIIILSSFYWLPGIFEKPYVLGETGLDIHFSRTFLSFNKAVIEWKYWFNLGLGLTIFLVLALIIHIAVKITKKNELSNSKVTWLLSGILFYSFLCLSPSSFIWENVSLLQANQFVTRMLFPLAVISALYIAINFQPLLKSNFSHWACVILVLLLFAQSRAFIKTYTTSMHNKGSDAIFVDDTEAHIQSHLKYYSSLTSGWGISEFKPSPQDLSTLVDDSGCSTNIKMADMQLERKMTSFSYQTTQAGCWLRLPRYWHIRYRAQDEANNELTIFYNQQKGIVLKAPKTSGTISLNFADPWYVKLSNRVSLAALILLALFYGFFLFQKNKIFANQS